MLATFICLNPFSSGNTIPTNKQRKEPKLWQSLNPFSSGNTIPTHKQNPRKEQQDDRLNPFSSGNTIPTVDDVSLTQAWDALSQSLLSREYYSYKQLTKPSPISRRKSQSLLFREYYSYLFAIEQLAQGEKKSQSLLFREYYCFAIISPASQFVTSNLHGTATLYPH